MLIKYIIGNIFDSQCDAIVNPVNCVDVMGKGLALQFKEKYPDMFRDYKRVCGTSEIGIGKLYWWATDYWLGNGSEKTLKHIINFPTKRHWGNSSKLAWIQAGLSAFIKTYKCKCYGINSVAFPALGCGYGGLDRVKVKMLMERYLERLDILCEVYNLQEG